MWEFFFAKSIDSRERAMTQYVCRRWNAYYSRLIAEVSAKSSSSSSTASTTSKAFIEQKIGLGLRKMKAILDARRNDTSMTREDSYRRRQHFTSVNKKTNLMDVSIWDFLLEENNFSQNQDILEADILVGMSIYHSKFGFDPAARNLGQIETSLLSVHSCFREFLLYMTERAYEDPVRHIN